LTFAVRFNSFLYFAVEIYMLLPLTLRIREQ